MTHETIFALCGKHDGLKPFSYYVENITNLYVHLIYLTTLFPLSVECFWRITPVFKPVFVLVRSDRS